MGSTQIRRGRGTICNERWADIKPRFIQLFCAQNQNKTLKQTMDILQQEGFNATVKQYKTQIRKWKIGKYNKDRAMRHVLRKDRHFRKKGVRKLYRVQGRPVTADDAQEHFRRKGIATLDNVEPELSASPTPSILTVVSDDSVPSAQPEESVRDSLASRFHAILPTYSSGLVSIPSSCRGTMRPSLRIPDALRETEQLIRAVCVLCKDSMSRSWLQPEHSMSTCNALQKCLDAANAGMVFGKLQDALEAYTDAQDLLHSMLRQRDPYIVVILCELVQCFLRFVHRGNRTFAPVTECFLRYAIKLATSVHLNHPLRHLPMLLTEDTKICRHVSNKLLEVIEHELRCDFSKDRLDHISWYHRRYGMIYGGFQDEVEGMLLNEMHRFEELSIFDDGIDSQAAARLETMALLLECYSMKKEYLHVLQWCQKILATSRPAYMYHRDYQYRRWSVMCSNAWANARLNRNELAILLYEEAEQYAMEHFGHGSYTALYSQRLRAGFKSAY